MNLLHLLLPIKIINFMNQNFQNLIIIFLFIIFVIIELLLLYYYRLLFFIVILIFNFIGPIK